MDGLSLTPGALAETIALIDEGVISGKIAKDVLPRLLEGGGNSGVRVFVEAQGLVQISGAATADAAGCQTTAHMCCTELLLLVGCQTCVCMCWSHTADAADSARAPLCDCVCMYAMPPHRRVCCGGDG